MRTVNPEKVKPIDLREKNTKLSGISARLALNFQNQLESTHKPVFKDFGMSLSIDVFFSGSDRPIRAKPFKPVQCNQYVRDNIKANGYSGIHKQTR